MTDFSYQKLAAKQVLKNALNSSYIASVLAACPSSGKTTISQQIINLYLERYPDANIIVLTEGQNNLKNQYIDELDNAHIPINFQYGNFESNKQVKVGLPQSINHLNLTSIDLLIVDEAHNFYFAKTVQDIIKKYNPKHQILMTGSPTKYNLFNSQNTKKFGMYYISAEELKDKGVFSGVDIDVVKVNDRKNARVSIESVMSKAIVNGDNTSKIMVACPSIKYANEVNYVLRGMGHVVAISTSQNDPNDKEIERFKKGEADVLVVVGKGILGFNDRDMTMLIDLRSSDSLDASYQLFARILRTHPKGLRKSYFRIADKDYRHQSLTAYKMCALMKKDVFRRYNGRNLKIV